MTKVTNIGLDDTRLLIGEMMLKLDLGELAEVYAMVRPRAFYRDAACAERACDHCGNSYRGPAVFCSLRCALGA